MTDIKLLQAGQCLQVLYPQQAITLNGKKNGVRVVASVSIASLHQELVSKVERESGHSIYQAS